MQGRRVPVPASGDMNEVIFDFEPGDYCGPVVGFTGTRPAVWMRLPVPAGHPDDGIRHVVSPPHVFSEQPDGSLEIRESILALRSPDGAPGWHGYLDAGHRWREC
jgi:hypothetical protein